MFLSSIEDKIYNKLRSSGKISTLSLVVFLSVSSLHCWSHGGKLEPVKIVMPVVDSLFWVLPARL
jgi:hypothetical protein